MPNIVVYLVNHKHSTQNAIFLQQSINAFKFRIYSLLLIFRKLRSGLLWIIIIQNEVFDVLEQSFLFLVFNHNRISAIACGTAVTADTFPNYFSIIFRADDVDLAV